MANRSGFILIIMWLASTLQAQESATVFLHPYPVLRAASEVIGTDRHHFVLIFGNACAGKMEQYQI